jgi:Ankyrin repeats (many copies)
MRRAGRLCCQACIRFLTLDFCVNSTAFALADVTLMCDVAASAGHEGAVQLLLEAGADVNARTKGGRSALHYAASKGHIRVAKILIEAGR